VTASLRNNIRTKPVEVHCQNCGHAFAPKSNTEWNSGDRVLVAKYAFHVRDPKRFDVPVFKFPEAPYHSSELTAMNYIKRLVGLPGETIAIYNGDLYRTTALTYPNRERAADSNELWRRIPIDYTYGNDPDAVELFNNNGFEMIRKSPDEILTVRRLVFDLDHSPSNLTDRLRTRWALSPGEDAGWTMQEKGFRHQGNDFGWVHYSHVQPGWTTADDVKQPELITDHLAYNIDEHTNRPRLGYNNWVPDLLVECDAQLEAATDEITLELTKAGDRYQAIFAEGKCKLVRYPNGDKTPRVDMGETATAITKAGKYSLRFANVDARLTIWVNGKPLDFNGAADYPTPSRTAFKPEKRDRDEPARIGCKGNVTFTKVKLWRDVYYTCETQANNCGVQTYYVQPDHYFCLGDNSASSSDGRVWGLVPKRLLLGRAVVVYWPWYRWGIIE
jgi:signal peptidase I